MRVCNDALVLRLAGFSGREWKLAVVTLILDAMWQLTPVSGVHVEGSYALGNLPDDNDVNRTLILKAN